MAYIAFEGEMRTDFGLMRTSVMPIATNDPVAQAERSAKLDIGGGGAPTQALAIPCPMGSTVSGRSPRVYNMKAGRGYGVRNLVQTGIALHVAKHPEYVGREIASAIGAPESGPGPSLTEPTAIVYMNGAIGVSEEWQYILNGLPGVTGLDLDTFCPFSVETQTLNYGAGSLCSPGSLPTSNYNVTIEGLLGDLAFYSGPTTITAIYENKRATHVNPMLTVDTFYFHNSIVPFGSDEELIASLCNPDNTVVACQELRDFLDAIANGLGTMLPCAA